MFRKLHEPSERAVTVFIDGVPVAGLPPGGKDVVRGLVKGKYVAQWRSFLGDVVFTPDGAKKNSGPQGIAQIRNGRYDTAAAEGKGVAGGPMVLHVTGLSGPGGQLLCEYEIRVELPRSDGTYDIEVPKKGAAKGALKKGDI